MVVVEYCYLWWVFKELIYGGCLIIYGDFVVKLIDMYI